MAEQKKCAHPICECMVGSDSEFGKFCSDRCRAAGDTTELRCDCKHPACR